MRTGALNGIVRDWKHGKGSGGQRIYMKKLRIAIAIILIVVMAIVMVAFLTHKFTNPHLTETELSIYFLRK